MTKKEAKDVWELMKEDIKKELIEMGFMRFAGADGNNKKAGKTVKELKEQKNEKE